MKTPKPISKILFGILCTTLISLFLCSSVTAQSVINASGGSQNSTSGNFAYSIGEMTLVSTKNSGDITLTQGLLQVESDYLKVRQPDFQKQDLLVFPNPVKKTLRINPTLNQSGDLHLKLLDLQNRVIRSKTVYLQTGQEQQKLNLSALQEGTYLLRVNFKSGGQNYHQVFKIIKKHDN